MDSTYKNMFRNDIFQILLERFSLLKPKLCFLRLDFHILLTRRFLKIFWIWRKTLPTFCEKVSFRKLTILSPLPKEPRGERTREQPDLLHNLYGLAIRSFRHHLMWSSYIDGLSLARQWRRGTTDERFHVAVPVALKTL